MADFDGNISKGVRIFYSGIKRHHVEAYEMGRKEKSWHKKLRLQLWYWPVAKLMGNEPDYGLDWQFAYKKRLSPPERKHRRRVFEWIRKESREPRGGHPTIRKIDEIVRAVDADPRFKETKNTYYCGIWEILAMDSIPAKELVLRIEKMLKKYKLERRSPDSIPGYNVNTMLFHESKFAFLLNHAMAEMSEIEAGYLDCLIALVSNVASFAGIFTHRQTIGESLRVYFIRVLGESGGEYYEQVRMHILNMDIIDGKKKPIFGGVAADKSSWPICKIGQVPVFEHGLFSRFRKLKK